ncbi:MAG TPA: M36 family metallopeptidase [Pyrinomonadaceae bacterium]|jgi:hypothetical protein
MSTKKGSGKSGKKRKPAAKKGAAAEKGNAARAASEDAGTPTPAPSFDTEGMPTISLEDSEISHGPSGRPRKIRGEFALPTSAAAAAAVDAGDESASLSGTVQSFLRANSDAIGMSADATSLRPLQEVSTPIGHVVRFQRLHDGIPVVDASVVVHVDEENKVKQIDLGDAPQVVAPAPAATAAASDSGGGRARKLTTKQALKAAQDAIGKQAAYRQEVKEPTEVYMPGDAGLRLAYLVVAPTREPEPHDWRILVDAYTGEILEKRDMIVLVNGTGLVFDPNPVVTSHNSALRDPDATVAGCGFAGTARATIDAQRVSRTLRDITFSGGVHRLEGPFVKMRNFGAPNAAPPTEVNANAFNYSSGDDRFEAVNVYYHVDTAQRYIQGLGITTAHNKVIECDAHEGSGAAFFSPIDGGLHFSDSGPCRPDRAEDGHVMFHEYGHAIQNNQVPGWGAVNPGTGRNEMRAMGEGFGDIFATVFFSDHGGGGFMREVFEPWVFGDTAIHGLRRVDGTKVYPTDWHEEEHDDGEIWSAALWNIFRTIGGDSANAATRKTARDSLLKTLIVSHHLMAANGTMPDGAEALMNTNASLPEFRGKHLIEMLNSFHDRGLLRSPVSGVDLWIKDEAGHTGGDAFGGAFWNSPDLWVRNADDNGTTHQPPKAGQDNFFYARVRNRGTQTARAFVVTFNAKVWAGTEFVYPGDFIPFVSAAVGFNLAPGGTRVVKARWPKAFVPAAGTHVCWLASVYTPVDPTPAGRHVWEHNNLAQKNLVVLAMSPGDTLTLPFQLGTLERVRAEVATLEVRRPAAFTTLPISIVHQNAETLTNLFRAGDEARKASAAGPNGSKPSRPVIRFLDPGRVEIVHHVEGVAPLRLSLGANSSLDVNDVLGESAPADAPLEFAEAVSAGDLSSDATTRAATLAFKPGATAGFPVTLKPRTAVSLGLKLTVPRETKSGDVIEFHLTQRNSQKQIVGGITYQVNVK